MSSIDKLAIRGIRSFDSDELSIIQFYTPLTVIVGHNGSGKTTIIECLKYAATGDLPPNTKGGAFVHDPAMAGTKEVKAEVKLRFRNTNKDRMIVDRRLQVTKKGNSLSMKTLEGTLAFTDKDGDLPAAKGKGKGRQTISTKCSELDEEVPSMLGVSRSILENVIFCHQEDSNWPLSEPAALKKKFDEIFEATKYTKALDHIKSIRKEQTVTIKVDKEKLIAAKTDRERAQKLSKQITDLQSEIDLKRIKYDDLSLSIKNHEKSNMEFYNGATKYSEIMNRAETLLERRRLKMDVVDGMRETMMELPESDEELREKRNNYQAHLAAAERERESVQDGLEEAKRKSDGLRKMLGMKFSEEGKLKGEKERYERDLEDRQSLVVELSGRHQIPGYDYSPLEPNKIDEFLHKLSSAHRGKIESVARFKTEARQSEAEKRKVLDDLRNQETTWAQEKRSLKQQIDGALREISRLGTQIESKQISHVEIKASETDANEKRQRISDLKEELVGFGFDEKVKIKDGEIREIEERRDRLHGELAGLNAQGETRARLGIKRNETKKWDEMVESLLNRHAPKFRNFTGVAPTRENIESTINEQQDEKQGDLAGAEKMHNANLRELAQTEQRVTQLKAQEKSLEEEYKVQIEKVREAMVIEDAEPDDYNDHIRVAEEWVHDAEASMERADQYPKFLQNVLKRAKDSMVCMACNRAFQNDAEVQKLEAYVDKKLNENPKRRREAQQDLDTYTPALAKLKAVQAEHISSEKIKNRELPNIRSSLQEQETKLKGITQKTEQSQQAVNKIKDQLSELDILRKAAADVARLNKDVQAAQREIADLERELEISGSTQTADSVQQKLEELGDALKRLKRDRDNLLAEKSKKERALGNQESVALKAEMKLKEDKFRLSESEALEARQNERREEVSRMEQNQQDLDKQIEDNRGPLRRAKDELAQLEKENSDRERVEERQANVYANSLNQLESINKELQKYITRGGDRALQDCQKALDDINKRMGECQNSVDEHNQKMQKLDKDAADAKTIERNLGDNLRYRDLKKEIQGIKDELESLDVDEVKKMKRRFENDYQDRVDKVSAMQASHAQLGGELKTNSKVLKERQQEMAENYKDAHQHYREQLIKVKTAEVANDDLEKYGKALDKAIMQFHTHKMEEINDTMAHLWNRTYQGTDIDKIMIRSDHDNTKGNRIYNYRVCMVKDQVEMDMRGRCSAGQKVLASIIIRLALAESFGTNCGILALDEPTTNLDRDNIQALALSLAEIIKERRGQSNFQLIVITHDEAFLSELGKSDCLNYYWRVMRSSNQCSQIERQRLEELG